MPLPVIAAAALWAKVKAARSWLTLLAVAVAGAYFYVEFAQVRTERNRYAAWIDVACASAGSSWGVTAGAPKGTRPGQQCTYAVRALAKYKLDAATGAASELTKAMQERDGKTNQDSKSARLAAEQARDAANRMEAENGKVEGDRVGGSWFDALNRAAGLQPGR